MKSQFNLSFRRWKLISCESVRRKREIAILPQFLAIELHFVRKRSPETRNRNFTSVFGDRSSFRAKGLRPETRNRNFTLVFGDRTSFRAKGLRPETRNRNFTLVFGDRTSFRAKGLRFVPSRWHCPAPSKREIETKERARGQESKRAREQEGKRECEDVKMRR